MSKKSSCEIILGTYEEFLLGFKYTKKAEEPEQTFAVHSHVGSIRCVAQSGDHLASGGSDDRIVVYNLKTRKQHCLLDHHKGTVNCLQFTIERKHLMTGGQDGILSLVRVGSWILEKSWENAHNGAAILDIAMHSSGKLAVTLGADSTLRTWNLVKGRQAYIINLNSKSKEPRCLHSIKWAPDGIRFVLAGSKYTDIWSIATGGVLKSIEHKHKISSCIWQSDEKIIVGYDDGNIAVVHVETEEFDVRKAHESRVKCLSLFGKTLITASSTGEIKVWSTKFKELCVANPGCRFTCMCVVPDEVGVAESSIIEANECVIEVNEVTDEDVVESPSKRKKHDKKSTNIKIKQEDIQVEQVNIIKEDLVAETHDTKTILKKKKMKNGKKSL